MFRAGGYLGVYHALASGVFVTKLARSSDLLRWSRVADLADHGSQPTIAVLPGGGFLVASRTLSKCAEGTPNVYAADLSPDISHSVIDVGFHYFRNCDVDRQARGTLRDFSSWSAHVEGSLNGALEGFRPGGNIGAGPPCAPRDPVHPVAGGGPRRGR